MRKFKNMFLTMTLFACTLFMCGMINAKAAFNLSGINVVCDPKAIEAGGRADCWIVGATTPGADAETQHGYVVHTFTTKSLKLVGAVPNDNIVNTDFGFTVTSSGNNSQGDLQLKISDIPDAEKTFKCTNDSSTAQAKDPAVDYGCAVFYSTAKDTKAFTPTSIKNNFDYEGKGVPNQLGVIGAIRVELDKDYTGHECGEICVKVFNIEEASQYSKYKTCASDAGDPTCNGVGVIGDSYFCQELTMQGSTTEPDVETGAFASYTVLIAGALIAISAIAMAKKNNKFSRI